MPQSFELLKAVCTQKLRNGLEKFGTIAQLSNNAIKDTTKNHEVLTIMRKQS